jgi:hypothetical protein
MATAAAIAPVAAATAPNDDSELVALGRTISDLQKLERTALEEAWRLSTAADEMTPAKPPEMLWRDLDPVPSELRIETCTADRWCSMPAVLDLANRPPEFWVGHPARERGLELIAAWRSWRDATERARARSGYAAAYEAVEAIQATMNDVYRRMLQLRPTTLEGCRALAQAIVDHCWGGEVRRHERDGTDDHGIAVLMSALTGVSVSDFIW